MTNLRNPYLGFINTPNLWENASDFGLDQLEISSKDFQFHNSLEQRLRLGKLVERFVSHQLEHDKDTSILAENIQIQDRKITKGELDCLLKQKKSPIHLEVIYKFYLYDATVGTTEIDHWIGPNRKDSLNQKLNKLKEKQLPLLYHPLTKPLLQSLDLDVTKIQQKVNFKAQLFIPLNKQNQEFKIINKSCIKGFYINQQELQKFKDCKFYIPKKIDWLSEVNPQVNWLNFDAFSEELSSLLSKSLSPMCWLKSPNGKTQKCFVVWW
ncbi:DUF1853 family protein [Oceanihabitans sediminis]|uniref:DUF1853 family protein n=1 Tax=Oceanihabitans sediminis TaxID=1812012 RepID=A0A368P6B5_9FLAO|nr:DUF1853 family protein [Oceanihabitans sediminis]MDX1278214.1 DUF1853 family protein [Oceanihabitans sediminis]MDX1773719.1 DUF1853 family protein [Oceanihabitans sediminis]RBP33164.1 hypothetical protein DFR65_102504 [Oceanihabitans sediminis]RCU57329.1 DUF1853 family protein [Oceanihabitans sediminis]